MVLIHGLGRTRASLAVLGSRFRAAGYEVVNVPYSASDGSLEDITEDFRRYVETEVKTPRYHLMGHSLGNVVIRNSLRRGLRPGLGRIVMLAPPNRPARLARLLKDKTLFRWLLRDSGQKLSEEDFYRTLSVPSVEFAVIAGDKGQRLTFREPNDGIVDVEGSKLPGMKAFAVVHHSHTFLMNAEDTFSLAKRFLETGELR